MKIIIDKEYNKYQPLMNISKIDLFEINLKKHKILYIFIDNLKLFRKIYKKFTNNCIFIINRNIVFDFGNDFEFIYKSVDFDSNYNFKNKVIRYIFLREYINEK